MCGIAALMAALIVSQFEFHVREPWQDNKL